MPSPKPGPLALAAIALEADLVAFEEAVGDVAKVRLDTRKNLERCARDVQRASDIYTRMQHRIGELGAQLQAAQERALDAVGLLRDLGTALQARQEGYVERIAAYETLMSEAAAIGALAQQGPEAMEDVRTAIVSLATRAAEMAAAAREAGFRDLAEEASGRHQQLAALANKLGGLDN